MNKFQNRKYAHDKIVIPYIQQKIKQFGLKAIMYGVEVHDKDLQSALMKFGRSDDAILKDRFKPDLYIIQDPSIPCSVTITALCEVKTEFSKHKNFAIEFDSYCAARLWSNENRRVIYAFSKLDDDIKYIKCCFIDDITIYSVRVPRRFDFERNMNELTEKYPETNFIEVEHNSGSGTPYFLIGNKSSYLKEFDEFFGLLTEYTTEPLQLSIF